MKRYDCLPYSEDRGATHWEGCEAHPGHHNCAVHKLNEAQAIIDEANAERDRAKQEANDWSHAYFDKRKECADAEARATLAKSVIDEAVGLLRDTVQRLEAVYWSESYAISEEELERWHDFIAKHGKPADGEE